MKEEVTFKVIAEGKELGSFSIIHGLGHAFLSGESIDFRLRRDPLDGLFTVIMAGRPVGVTEEFAHGR